MPKVYKIETGGPILFFSEGIQTATLLPDGQLTVREPGGDGVTTYPHWRAFLREIDADTAESTPEAERLLALKELLGTPKTPDGKAIQVETPQPVGTDMGTPQPRRRGRPPRKTEVPPTTPTVLEQLAAEAAAAAKSPEQPPEPTAEGAREEPTPEELAADTLERDVRRLLQKHGLRSVLRRLVWYTDAVSAALKAAGLAGSNAADCVAQVANALNTAVGWVPTDL